MDSELFSLLFLAYMLGWFSSLAVWQIVFHLYLRFCKKGGD